MILCPEGQVSNELTPNRDKIDMIRRVLLMIWSLQLFLALSKIIISFQLCLSELIACLILYLSITQLNFCNCVGYIVLSIFNLVAVIAFIGNQLCHNIDIFQVNMFKTIVCYATMGFYSFSLPIAFQGYKNFKGIVYDMLLSQTNCEQEFVTRQSNISINGFQQPLKISDLEPQSPNEDNTKTESFSISIDDINQSLNTEIDLQDAI
ncbi:hypothetical protein ABPG72_021325 [Tetrahymena utriculariae]